MKVCPSCQNEQEAGKFCGSCGTALVDQAPVTPAAQAPKPAVEEQAATVERPVQASQAQQPNIQQQQQAPSQQQAPNEQFEALKSNSKVYFNYFLEKLKTPTSAPDFKFGLVNIIAFLLITAIAFFVSLNSQSFVDIPFFGVVFSVTFSLAIFILISMLAIFLTTLFSSEKPAFKQIIEQYGNYSSITISLSTLALLLFLFKSFFLGAFIIAISLGITFIVQPTFIINRYIQTLKFSLDKYFMYLIFIGIQAVLYAIFVLVTADSFIGELLDEMMFFF